MKKNTEEYRLLTGKSQAEKVYWYLQINGSITNMQCHEIFGIRHAPSVIRDLRKKFRLSGGNYEIVNEEQKGVNRFGEPCRWVKYKLVNKETEDEKKDYEQRNSSISDLSSQQNGAACSCELDKIN